MLRKFNAYKNRDTGFTLVELLVVVLIIGILAAIAVPIYLNVQNGSKKSTLQSDVATTRLNVAAALTQEKKLHDGTDSATVGTKVLNTKSVADEVVTVDVDTDADGNFTVKAESASLNYSYTYSSLTKQSTPGTTATNNAGGNDDGNTTVDDSNNTGDGYATTVQNASFNDLDGHVIGITQNIGAKGLTLGGGLFDSSGGVISGSQPVLNGMNDDLTNQDAYYRTANASQLSDVHFFSNSGSEITGFGNCAFIAYDLPGAYAGYFGFAGVSGDAVTLMGFTCATTPPVTKALANSLVNGKVTFTTSQGVNTFKITQNLPIDGATAADSANLNVPNTAEAIKYSVYPNVTGLHVYLTKTNPAVSWSDLSTVDWKSYIQYGGDGSQLTTSTLDAFNGADLTLGYQGPQVHDVKIYDKNGNDISDAYPSSDDPTWGAGNLEIWTQNEGTQIAFMAGFSFNIQKGMTQADFDRLEGGKVTFTVNGVLNTVTMRNFIAWD